MFNVPDVEISINDYSNVDTDQCIGGAYTNWIDII